MFNFLKPAKHIDPLPSEKVDDTYKKLRLQVFFRYFYRLCWLLFIEKKLLFGYAFIN